MTTGTPSASRPATPRRSRVRTFLPLGIAAWLVLEIWLLTVVAGAAGGFTVFLLLLAGIVLGAVVIKRAGRRAFRNLSETLQRQQSGAVPAGEQRSEGNGLVMLAGLLLMIPGLVSDALGLLLLVPPVRTTLSRYTERTIERKMQSAAPGTFGDAFQQARMHRPDGTVIQGEVIKDDERPAQRPDAGPRPPIAP
ncbi:FxsA family membrane protein [Streptomyces sp. NBC_00401]|uniref:FxsA family membrane protein n=1 Tax=Streptomyces sp. NBC_00401 TaxID=2975738 RepID=UPI002259FA40|nr:FxsA family membrane protein [Streptomyces sp. NBC_00401]MCX5080381.1 FxsA family protein [Streptomyces sp. NBC_00401]